MASITIDDRRVDEVLVAMARKADDLEPMFDEWGHYLVTDTKRRFATETDPEGRPWTPLAPATLKAKAKRRRTKILQMDGHLRNSITHQATRTELVVGTPMEYGPTHQFGARIERHAQTIPGSFRFWRDVKVTREDGTSFTRKQLVAANTKRKITMMARTLIGAASFSVPARPFLGLSAEGIAGGKRIAGRYFVPEGGA